MAERPLLATSKGNIPIEGLRHEVTWVVSLENIIFRESYFQGSELVKESSHVCVLKGAAAIGEATI